MDRARTLILAVPALAALLTATPVPDDKAKDSGTKTTEKLGAKTTPTADNQSEGARDRETTRQIRRALMNDKSLSTSAHNVKVITRGGKVTLKGVVPSEDEKKAVEAKATEVAGAGSVTNDLTVGTAKAAAKAEQEKK